MSRMLQDHDGVQPRSDSRAVCGLFNSPVSAHWRQSTSHRGVLIQEEAALAVLPPELKGRGGDGPVDISALIQRSDLTRDLKTNRTVDGWIIHSCSMSTDRLML